MSTGESGRGPADDLIRCWWSLSGGASIGRKYIEYHDDVWGVPQRDPHVLFEFLILEGAQAGLSWSTILNKVEGYRTAFAGFDPRVIASYGEADVERLMADAGIVRNRLKITSAIGNARAWLELDDAAETLWSFTGGETIQNAWQTIDDVPNDTAASSEMSKALKKLGFRFVGPTICYAFMQATGMVNDHVTDCFRHAECAALG